MRAAIALVGIVGTLGIGGARGAGADPLDVEVGVDEPSAYDAVPVFKLDRPVVGRWSAVVTPQVVLRHRGMDVEGIAGYGAELELHLIRKRVVVESEWRRFERDGAVASEWSVQLAVGGRLDVPTRELFGLARSGLGLAKLAISRL